MIFPPTLVSEALHNSLRDRCGCGATGCPDACYGVRRVEPVQRYEWQICVRFDTSGPSLQPLEAPRNRAERRAATSKRKKR